MVQILGAIAEVYLKLEPDHPEIAENFVQQRIGLGRQLGDRRILAKSLEDMAGVALVQKQFERAVRLLSAMEAVCTLIGAPLSLLEQATLAQKVSVARDYLDNGVFDAAWAEGQVMTLEQAIDYALSEN